MTETIVTTTSTVTMDDGVCLHVKVLGDDAKATKPLLIALHGAPGLSTLLDPESSFAFLSGTFRVLVFDARGSGASDLTGPYTHERWINDIEHLRKWAGAEKFVLAGGSYGGFIALDYALVHGDRLLGIILRDTWAHGVVGMMTALANVVTSDRLKVDVARQVRVWSGILYDDKDFEESVLEILPIYDPPEEVSNKAPMSGETQPKVFEGLAETGSGYHSATQNAAFCENMPRFDVRHRLKEIKAPTLVVVGRHDYITPVHFSQEIADGIPNTRLEIFEYSGHNPPADEPEKFRDTVWSFLKAEVL
ncbi:hypothetical protein BP6252_08986 [Coleophoma cylindrospora]|uniref:AB hydrolase-1 domain-containing protein n=1 Tax=Coleophoma cylindrospora TaxID=1849047 RepID=A0A3D8R0Y0_9HELO|nr:hypothetical protein BP6252_08986 [Coleophoma cylindrospora]